MKKVNLSEIPLVPIVGYEHLKIYQPSSFFRTTSDAVALADFVKLKYTDHKILDIGTGLGGIAIILGSNDNVEVTGVEILEEASYFASCSVQYNHLEDKVFIVHQDICDYAKEHLNVDFDIIVANPPYFDDHQGYLNKQGFVANAKHEQTLTIEKVIQIASQLIKNHGKLDLVFTTERCIEVIQLMEKYHFAVKRIQFLHGGKTKVSKRFLIEGVKNGKIGLKVLPPIIRK